MIVLCKYASRYVHSMCQSFSLQHHFSHRRETQIVFVVLILLNYHVYPQPENEEKLVIYNNIGPNVCMGDHKVTSQINSPSLCVCCLDGNVQNNVNIVKLVTVCS